MHMRRLAQNLNIDGVIIEGPGQDAPGGGLISLNDSIGTIISASLSYIFAFAGLLLLLQIIGSGFTIMLSAGDAKKLAKGRSALTTAIVGFLVIFAAFWIVQIVGVVFGWENDIIGVFGL